MSENPFFKTMEEREDFFRALHEGNPVPPGCWFRHAIQAGNILGNEPYGISTLALDCAQIAVAEIKGITNVTLDRWKLGELPVFRFMFDAMRASGVAGLRDCIIKMSSRYDPLTEKIAIKNANMIPENPSPAVIQQWATLFARWIVQLTGSHEPATSIDDDMIEAGVNAAHRLGYTTMTPKDLSIIWHMMTAFRKVS